MAFMYHLACTFLMFAIAARAAPCSTLQACVDAAAASVVQMTLNVTLPPVLQVGSGNCNVIINGNGMFNRVVISGTGESSTAIDCTSTGAATHPQHCVQFCSAHFPPYCVQVCAA